MPGRPAFVDHPAWRALRVLLGALGSGRLRLRAMALTYISLFALVPAVVVAFSLLTAFSGMDALWKAVHAFIIDNLAVGARATVTPYLDRFVRNAHATSAGVVGGAVLVYSALALFTEVEQALNDLWAVRQHRRLVQRALIYWAGLTLGPFLLAGSLAVGDFMGGHVARGLAGAVTARLAATLLSCTLFALLYLLVPATRVSARAAAAGGVFAGVSFEAAKAVYTFVSARFFRYHAVYGSVAAVPIFLIWLHLSWTLLLVGARISFVVQHARVLLRGHAPEGEGTALGRELLAARALLEVALAYRDGRPPPDPGEVAERLATFAAPTREALTLLRLQGLVLEVSGGALVPARPLDQLTLADVRRAVSGAAPGASADPGHALVAGLLGEAELAATRTLAARTYADLCVLVRGPAPVAHAALGA